MIGQSGPGRVQPGFVADAAAQVDHLEATLVSWARLLHTRKDTSLKSAPLFLETVERGS